MLRCVTLPNMPQIMIKMYNRTGETPRSQEPTHKATPPPTRLHKAHAPGRRGFRFRRRIVDARCCCGGDRAVGEGLTRAGDGAVTGSAEGASGATMAEGPEEARSRPPGQDGSGGDHEPVPSGPGSPAAPQPPALATVASAVSEPEPQCELRKRRETGAEPQEPGGCEASDGPGRLSAREYSRQVHEWLWQSYCGYLTWHSGLAALPAYCGPPPAAPQPAAPPPPPPPPPPQLAYYNPFYFLSAAGPGPGAATGGTTPTAVAGLTARAPHVQASARAAPVTRVGSAAPARTASDTGRQAGENEVGVGGWDVGGIE